MKLPDGKVMAQGIIIGAWPPLGGTVGVNRARILSDVALKLRQQYALAVQLSEGCGKLTEYLSLHVRTGAFPAGRNGAVARVVQGAGVVIVCKKRYNIDTGDWAYIPHGLRFTFEGRVIAGMSFQVAHADLLPG